MSTARVVAVTPGSPAERSGLLPGDEILAVDGEPLRDVIAYQLQADEPLVHLEVRRGGLERAVTVRKQAGAPLGAQLDSPVFDRVRTCDNHCPFCFIYQLPAGMRPSLYVKDDDYRLSFLYGNFTTLTRFTEADLERVVSERLSPLYVSIHATDPELRSRLLRNRRGGTGLRWLGLLLEAGIEVHGQIVVCPGINDGEALDETMLGVLDRFPALATVGVVPLGVSAHNDEPELRPHRAGEAADVLATVDRWQERFLAALGRRMVFAADEYHLMTGRELPPADEYEGFPQHENGVGIVRAFHDDVRAALEGRAIEGRGPHAGFFAWVEEGSRRVPSACGAYGGMDAAPATGYRATRGDGSKPVPIGSRPDPGRPVWVVTGRYGARALEPLLGSLEEAASAPVRLLPVDNRFFGGNIAVTGLLTGSDVRAALGETPAGDRVLLPDVVLSEGRFLDGSTLADLGRPVEVVPTDGASLVRRLRGEAAAT